MKKEEILIMQQQFKEVRKKLNDILMELKNNPDEKTKQQCQKQYQEQFKKFQLLLNNLNLAQKMKENKSVGSK